MTISETLDAILVAQRESLGMLSAILAVLEGPPPDEQPADRETAIAQIESAAELVRTGLLRRK